MSYIVLTVQLVLVICALSSQRYVVAITVSYFNWFNYMYHCTTLSVLQWFSFIRCVPREAVSNCFLSPYLLASRDL